MMAGLRRTAAAYRLWLSALVAPLIVGSLSLPVIGAEDPCTLLPGQPAKKELAADPRPGHTSCMGKYWVREALGPNNPETETFTIQVR